MSLGDYLRDIRTEREFTLREVERIAKEGRTGAELSSGYLSMLERDEVKEPSPRILFALAKIYEIDYIDLMKRANYIPEKVQIDGHTPAPIAFRGASSLKKEQRARIQRMIEFELSDVKKADKKDKE